MLLKNTEILELVYIRFINGVFVVDQVTLNAIEWVNCN